MAEVRLLDGSTVVHVSVLWFFTFVSVFTCFMVLFVLLSAISYNNLQSLPSSVCECANLKELYLR